MTTRHRRRSVQSEAIAPWVALSVVLLDLVGGRDSAELGTARCLQVRNVSFGARRFVRAEVEAGRRMFRARRQLSSPDSGPSISANTIVLGSDLDQLRHRSLTIPVRGLEADDLVSSFHDARGSSRRHEAIDILAPRGTDVLAVEDGKVAKLFTSDAGGLTVYQIRSVRDVRLLLRASRQLRAGFEGRHRCCEKGMSWER